MGVKPRGRGCTGSTNNHLAVIVRPSYIYIYDDDDDCRRRCSRVFGCCCCTWRGRCETSGKVLVTLEGEGRIHTLFFSTFFIIKAVGQGYRSCCIMEKQSRRESNDIEQPPPAAPLPTCFCI